LTETFSLRSNNHLVSLWLVRSLFRVRTVCTTKSGRRLQQA